MRLGVLASGGDAPGMNAAIHGFAAAARAAGAEPWGIREGWQGLLAREAAVIDPTAAARMARRGGCWLGVARLADFPSRLHEIAAAVAALRLDGLFVLGGDGSLRAAARLVEAGLPVAAAPATIDNDVGATDRSIGFATALETGLAMADRLADSAEALGRLFSIETLGGPTGYLADALARLAGADLLLAPEALPTASEAAGTVQAALAARGHALIVASEGVPDLAARLDAVAEAAGTRLRPTRLGHAQRGGAPVAADRALALASAETAAAALAAGESGVVGLREGRVALAAFGGHDAPPFPAGWRGLL